MISFLSSGFFFRKTENDVTYKGGERCCLLGEMKIAENISRGYFLVLPWEKLLQQI